MASQTGNTTSAPPRVEDLTFHWADYVVFIASLVVTAAIGLVFALVGRYRHGRNNTQEYLLASRSMNAIPVSLSLLGSLFNAVFILGGPADVYFYGLEGMWVVGGFLILAPVTAHLIIPTFYKMRLTSAYEVQDSYITFHLYHIVTTIKVSKLEMCTFGKLISNTKYCRIVSK